MIHTFVSNVRGPSGALELLGRPLVEVIPLSLASGNITVGFTALSYGSRLVITINAVSCPDLGRLCGALAEELAVLPLLRPAAPTVPQAGRSGSPAGGAP